MADSFDEIESRLNRLEVELRAVRETLSAARAEAAAKAPAAPAVGAAVPVSPVAPPVPAGTAAPAASVAEPAPAKREFEANLVGTWFARVGAAAIFFGAAFAFKYAVDRDLISPAGRVVVGLLVGLAFVAWGEWAYRKTWARFGQAVAGIGVAIGYLAVWAGYQLYDLTSPGVTLVLLALAVVGGAALAWRHNSLGLAVLAALGGFLNPLLISTGRGTPSALYLYLLLLNLGVVSLARIKQWRPLAAVAVGATWFVMMLSAQELPMLTANDWLGLGFATTYAAAFHWFFALPLRGETDDVDRIWLFLNSLAWFLLGLSLLGEGLHAGFALTAALIHLGAGAGLRAVRPSDAPAVQTVLVLGVAALTAAAAFQFEGPTLATAWALEAAAVGLAAAALGMPTLLRSAAAVFGLSVAAAVFEFEFGLTYLPERPVLSVESLPLIIQTAVLTAAAVVLRRRADPEIPAHLVAVLANVFAVGWLSLELRAFGLNHLWSAEAFTFALSSVWTAYSCGLLVFGIGLRAKWARLTAVCLLGLVIAKLVFADVWMLETPMRIAAFVGLGFVLLLISLGYHRFRALILG